MLNGTCYIYVTALRLHGLILIAIGHDILAVAGLGRHRGAWLGAREAVMTRFLIVAANGAHSAE
jgi:hypothetical protein